MPCSIKDLAHFKFTSVHWHRHRVARMFKLFEVCCLPIVVLCKKSESG